MFVPDVGMVDILIQADGKAVFEANGKSQTLGLDESDLGETYDDLFPWLILSHLATVPFEVNTSEGAERADPAFLLEVGTAPMVLLKPGNEGAMMGMPTHDIAGVGTIVCHEAGIIEVITYAIFRYLEREGKNAQDWIDLAIQRKSMPLLSRIHIALLQLQKSADQHLGDWADSTLRETVFPALTSFPFPHHEPEQDGGDAGTPAEE